MAEQEEFGGYTRCQHIKFCNPLCCYKCWVTWMQIAVFVQIYILERVRFSAACRLFSFLLHEFIEVLGPLLIATLPRVMRLCDNSTFTFWLRYVVTNHAEKNVCHSTYIGHFLDTRRLACQITHINLKLWRLTSFTATHEYEMKGSICISFDFCFRDSFDFEVDI